MAESGVRRLVVAWLVCFLVVARAQSAPGSLQPATAQPPATALAQRHPRTTPTATPTPPKVAIVPFVGEDIDPKKLSEATKRFQSRLSSTDSFWIAPSRKVDELLGQPGYKDSSACQTGDCSLEVGRQLGAESVFTGVVSQEVETWRLEVSRTDVQSGKILFDHVIEIYGSFDDLVSQGCPRMALIACGREPSDNNYTVLEGAGGGHAWPWIVGGIAVAAGGATAAVLFLTSGGSTPSTPGSAPDRLIVKW